MISFDNLAKEVFNTLQQYDYKCKMYDNDGNSVYEPSACRRFITDPNHMLVSIIDEGDDSSIRLYYSKSIDLNTLTDLFETMRSLASRYNLIFSAKATGKQIVPKTFSTFTSVSESIMSHNFYHTSKSTYLTLPNARMIAKKGLNESYNAVYVEDSNANRFVFPTNDIEAAAEMTSHVNNGGSFADEVGQQILQMASHFSELKSARICESFSEYRKFYCIVEGRKAPVGVDDESCPTCHGSGGSEEQDCPTCHGSGIQAIKVLGRQVSKMAFDKLIHGQISLSGTPTLPESMPANANLTFYFDLVVPYIQNLSLANLASHISEAYPEAMGDEKAKMRTFMAAIIKASGLKLREGFMTGTKAIREFMEWQDSFSIKKIYEAEMATVNREDILVPKKKVADLKSEVMLNDAAASYTIKPNVKGDNSNEVLHPIEVKGKEIGFISKQKDEPGVKHEWKAYRGKGHAASYLGSTRSQSAAASAVWSGGGLEESAGDFDGYMGTMKGGTTGEVCKTPLEAAQKFFAKYPEARKINVVPVSHGPNDTVLMYYRAPSYKDITKKNMADELRSASLSEDIDVGGPSIEDNRQAHAGKPKFLPNGMTEEQQAQLRALTRQILQAPDSAADGLIADRQALMKKFRAENAAMKECAVDASNPDEHATGPIAEDEDEGAEDDNKDTVVGSSYWASYFINGDDSALDEKDKHIADEWYENNVPEGWEIVDVGEPYFSWSYGHMTGDPESKGGELAEYTIVHRFKHHGDDSSSVEK